jgi:hypothetical protein
MTIEPFGDMNFIDRDNEWFGRVNNISPDNEVELSICVDNVDQDLTEKIKLINQFTADYKAIIADLYVLACKKYKDTEHKKSLEEITQMYFLAAVVLKNDNKTWWLTMEPNINVTSIYNHFLRFTMVDRKIVWANFDINTTA